jgi:uncharacterized membrane protein (Fun14 family)
MRIQDSGKEFGRWADKCRKFNMGFDTTLAATIGRGFFAGILVGYALKKVLKILAIVISRTIFRRLSISSISEYSQY